PNRESHRHADRAGAGRARGLVGVLVYRHDGVRGPGSPRGPGLLGIAGGGARGQPAGADLPALARGRDHGAGLWPHLVRQYFYFTAVLSTIARLFRNGCGALPDAPVVGDAARGPHLWTALQPGG